MSKRIWFCEVQRVVNTFAPQHCHEYAAKSHADCGWRIMFDPDEVSTAILRMVEGIELPIITFYEGDRPDWARPVWLVPRG